MSGCSGVGDSPQAQGASVDGLKLVRMGGSVEASASSGRIPSWVRRIRDCGGSEGGVGESVGGRIGEGGLEHG